MVHFPWTMIDQLSKVIIIWDTKLKTEFCIILVAQLLEM